MVNYISESYTILISNEIIEFSNNFEDGNKEESEKNEKETEIEDSDEYIFNPLCIYEDFEANNKYNILCKFIELSVFKEIDSPPPNC